MKKAVCLLSGGLDSTTAAYVAKSEGYDIAALTVDYGQLHRKEIESAKAIAEKLGLKHHVVSVPFTWKGSALLDESIDVPQERSVDEMSSSIPPTYVPARNSVFLSLAASMAEAIEAEAIFIGANALDYSGYPDCRPEYFEAFQEMLKRGTKAGTEGKLMSIKTPLLKLSKKEIVELGAQRGVPFELTWSCYVGNDRPCGQCDACLLRQKGFQEAGVEDPLIHAIPGN